MTFKIRTLMVMLIVTALLAADVPEVFAQRHADPMEFSVTYGSMWGGNIGTTGGKIRTGTGGSWGFAFDLPVGGGKYIEASYNRQEGSLDWDPNQGTKSTLTDMSVNFWQLGTIQSFGHSESFIPYLQGSLGATFFSPAQSQVLIDDEPYNIDSLTKFSITFGAGFKTFFGQSQKIGLRGSFKVLTTFFDSAGGVWFGPGGVSLGVSGSGIWQYEAAGGLVVRFGG